MNKRCLDPQELGLVLELPANDPRRLHLGGCVQCRGRVEALEVFLDPGDVSDLDELDTADAELAARMERMLSSQGRVAPRPRFRRISLAVAAGLALFAVGLTGSEILRTRDLPQVQSGQNQRGPADNAGISVTRDAQMWRLTWPAAPASETLVYTFLTGDLRELGRRESTGSLALLATDPLAGAEFCQVFAVATGDTIARSAISRLSLDLE